MLQFQEAKTSCVMLLSPRFSTSSTWFSSTVYGPAPLEIHQDVGFGRNLHMLPLISQHAQDSKTDAWCQRVPATSVRWDLYSLPAVALLTLLPTIAHLCWRNLVATVTVHQQPDAIIIQQQGLPEELQRNGIRSVKTSSMTSMMLYHDDNDDNA